ncbi:HD domain-containing protein [Pseudonocardia sediminis]|uniref:HD domain-containing protein n=1 Tax=Pseudonocardia sediminis TaxID=1397368 RepID=UPI001028D640|nr:HD domain-containing protein [Pseudonocardia sediminis]
MAEVDQAAYALAEGLLAQQLPDRWLHVQAVASQARMIGAALECVDAARLVQAATLHDIGYSPELADTGFHPLDGARFLAARDFDPTVVALVAHHSSAVTEARLRGVEGLDSFTDDVTATRDALWYCDATTGPRGERFSPEDRWAEVRERYGPGHVVTQFLDEAGPALRAAVARTEERMLAANGAQST